MAAWCVPARRRRTSRPWTKQPPGPCPASWLSCAMATSSACRRDRARRNQGLASACQGRDVGRRRDELPDDRPEQLADEPAVETTTSSAKRDDRKANQRRTRLRTIRREYTKPYIAHASIGPSAAIAVWTQPTGSVRPHSQGIYNLRYRYRRACCGARSRRSRSSTAKARLLRPQSRRRCRARRGRARPRSPPANRCAQDGPAPTNSPGATSPPAMAVAIEADLDASNEVVALAAPRFGNGHTSRPGSAVAAEAPRRIHRQRLPDGAISTNPPLRAAAPDRNAIPPTTSPTGCR